MDRLEKFFEDIHIIREILESKAKGDKCCSDIAEAQAPVVSALATSPVTIPTTPVVPISAQAESFTFEQIAQAMANAQAAGKLDLIQTIFRTFNAQTLMQINPANYNQIAVMLRNEGIQL